mgnify:CR=1 FL=1
MNERYLSRGKRKDNDEWVEGYYVCLNENCHRIYIGYAEKDCGDYYPEYCEVIPETVGKCTGLKDKNGKLIFEGDIVITNIFNTPEILYTITYDKQIAAFIGEYVKGCIKQFTTFDGDSQCFEVIGNIHDNPELLEVER